MSRAVLAFAGFLSATTPAAADVTPREVWEEWLATLQSEDVEVSTVSVEEAGDRLVVSGLSIGTSGEQSDRYALDLDEMVLVQNADGSVGVTVSPEYPMVLTGTDDDGVEHETHLVVRHPDLRMTVTDDAGTRRHAFSAPEIRILIEQVLEDGEPLDLAGTVVLEEAAGHYAISDADAGESALSATRVSFDMSGSDPETGERYAAEVGVEGFASDNVMRILSEDTAALARGLSNGESLAGSFSTTATSFAFESESEAETAAFTGTLGPGTTDMTVSADGMDYSTEARDLALAFSGSSIPLPQLTLSMGTTTVGLQVPLLADEDPQPYAFNMSMLEVALDEGLWNMVDPAGILPRDPGAVTLDVSGDIEVEQDVDARDMAEDAGDEIRTVKLNTARIAFVDSEIDATGDLKMAPSPAGMALPVGQIDVTLTGATKLLDRLTQVGIVPQEQAMGARMMLSMFARPGATDDEVVSTIRFTEDGHLFVNDQQVR